MLDFMFYLIAFIAVLAVALMVYTLAREARTPTVYRYRILQDGKSYRIQYRKWWDPYWQTHRWYEPYDRPREVTKYGGVFADIGYKATEYGRSTSWAFSEKEAHVVLEKLKVQHAGYQDKRDKSKPKPRVIHES